MGARRCACFTFHYCGRRYCRWRRNGAYANTPKVVQDKIPGLAEDEFGAFTQITQFEK
jgi:hypothetical protein